MNSDVSWRVGTSGWAYAPWRGPFYPDRMREDAYLAFYAARFSAVELNGTFYRMPKVGVVESWAATVPESFRFVMKAPQRISHFQRFKSDDFGALDLLLAAWAALGGRAGPLYFQGAENFKFDRDRLLEFLDRLPRSVPVAFEFRHASWHDNGVGELLAERGVALTTGDEGTHSEAVPTAPFCHLRLRLGAYDDDALRQLITRIRALNVAEAFVFFRHDDECTGPALAARFLALVDTPAPAPAPPPAPGFVRPDRGREREREPA